MQAEHAPRVSTVELFFDLVFVFTITQLTHLVDDAHDVLGFVRPLLVLTIIWWHYAGYVWLTNASGARDASMRVVLIAAMAGFLVMAVALPTIFGAGGLVFGLAYLFIVVLHLGTFAVRGGRAAWKGVAALAVINGGVAALVLAAGIVDAPWDWLFFLGGCALFVVSTLRRIEGGFSVRAGHFAERHGLVVIIALGESIISIGTGAAARPLDAWTLAAIVIALVTIAAVWWAYFDRDDVLAERALDVAPAASQARLALVGYWYTHLFLIAGVVLVATAIKTIVAAPLDVDARSAWLLAAGLATYFVGSVLFRRSFRIRPLAPRLVGGAAMAVVGGVGAVAPGVAVLGIAAGMAVGLLAIEVPRGRPAPG
jgi:low temperature requirement protein LtrA